MSSLENGSDSDINYHKRELALVVGWYNGLDLNDIELASEAHRFILQIKKQPSLRLIPLRVLHELGETGQNYIASLEIKITERHRNSEELEILGYKSLQTKM